MREILFRGKRIDNGEWVEGNLLVRKCYKPNGERTDELYISSMDIWLDEDGFSMGQGGMEELADPNTVGEYTGLKDKNGKMIFEGDILKIAKTTNGIGDYYIPPLDYPVDVVVKWDLCAWMWETLCEDKRYIGFPDAWCHYEAEIIGNIHDNPELLRGAE